MFCVYLIRFTNSGTLYIGSTNNLKRRIGEHAKRKSLELLYYEAYKSETDARRREHNLKYFGKAYGQLKQRIHDTLR